MQTIESYPITGIPALVAGGTSVWSPRSSRTAALVVIVVDDHGRDAACSNPRLAPWGRL